MELTKIIAKRLIQTGIMNSLDRNEKNLLLVEDENVDVEQDSELTSKSNSKNNNTVMCMGNYRQSFIGDWIY
jgi:hypothetical protein